MRTKYIDERGYTYTTKRELIHGQYVEVKVYEKNKQVQIAWLDKLEQNLGALDDDTDDE